MSDNPAFGIVCDHKVPRDEYCEACRKRHYNCRIYRSDLRGVQHKYRQLVREIEEGASKADMIHSAHKLGCFLHDLFGYAGSGEPGISVWNHAAKGNIHDY